MEKDIIKSKHKVMLVEDDKFLSFAYQKALEGSGYEVVVAANGNVVVDKAKEFMPDLIFLDLILPGKNGFLVLEDLKGNAELHDIPVIILSNLSMDGDMKKGMSMGASGYMLKADTSTARLIEKVKTLLGEEQEGNK